MITTNEIEISNKGVALIASFVQFVKVANRANSEEVRTYAENCAETWETMLIDAGMTKGQLAALRSAVNA